MLSIEEIANVIAFSLRRNVARVEIERPGFALKLALPPPVAQPEAIAPLPSPTTVAVRTAGFGRFVSRAPLSQQPLAPVGAEVSRGDVLGLLKVGALYRPIRSPIAGIVRQVYAGEGDLLGFGAETFEIEPYDSDD